MRSFTTTLLILLFSMKVYPQKKYNFGLSFGSEQFYAANNGTSPILYDLNNDYSYKLGVFVERSLNNNDEILLGFNYNYYWNNFTYLNGSDLWTDGMSNTFYDLDIHYNHLLTNRFKLFFGVSLIYYRFHDKYFGQWSLLDGTVYANEIKDVTDFNVALNSGLKYEINPKSKIKVEPFILLGFTAFKRDNYRVAYIVENVSSNHYYKHIYTRFGLNIKY